jgi:hypothetical protein
MRDIDVRQAIRRTVLVDHIRKSDTLIIEELGIAQGAARVDIAVVNGRFHGIEIKSDKDTLIRLPCQVALYSSVFDRVTAVVGQTHLKGTLSLVPDWWGIKCALAGSRGGVQIREHRAPRNNPAINPVCLAGMLWREEALSILEAREIRGLRAKNRNVLSERLALELPLSELRSVVRTALKARIGWRSDAQRAPYVDSSPPSAKL